LYNSGMQKGTVHKGNLWNSRFFRINYSPKLTTNMEKETFTTKLHEACSSDELRPVMMCIHFLDGFAYASDGMIVIKQSLEYHSIINSSSLNGKCLHKDNYKAIMQFEKATCDDLGVSCIAPDGRSAFFEYFDLKGVQMPNFESVLKPVASTPVSYIGIRPDLLNRLSKAMHSPDGILRIRFQGVDRWALVDVVGIENQCGVIMPAIINDTLFSS